MHTTTIAGIPHRKPDLSLLKVGDEVRLIAEPDNKFDPNAIRVFHNIHSDLPVHLGYIPRMETGLVAGVSTMFIHKIEPQNKWKEVTISTEVPDATN